MSINVNNIFKTIEGHDDIDQDIEYDSVCFIDILGFKKMIQSNLDEDEHQTAERCRIKAFIKSVAVILKKFKTEYKIEKHTSLILSDSIYIFFSKKDENVILQLITTIYLYGINNKIFFRGAISDKGVYYSGFDDQSIFLGQGIIESYELETYISNYSRVVFANEYICKYNYVDIDGYKIFDIVRFIKEQTFEIISLYNDSMDEIIRKESALCTPKSKQNCEFCKQVNNHKLVENSDEILNLLLKSVEEEKSKFEKDNKDKYQKLFSKYFMQYSYLKAKEGEIVG